MERRELGHEKQVCISGSKAKLLGYKVSHSCAKAKAVVEVNLHVNPRCPHCGTIFQIEPEK